MLTVRSRVAGLVAYTWVSTVMTPLGEAACLVQVTVIATPCCRDAAGSQVFVKSSDAGDGDFVTSQMWSLFWVAVMSLSISCGATSFGLIDTALVPMPEVLPVRSSARFACSDEPGYRCAPI